MSRPAIVVERLENRLALSAVSPIGYVPPSLGPNPIFADPVVTTPPTPAATPTPAKKPKPSTTPVVRATDLRGRWEGDIKTKILFVKIGVDADLVITEQTETTITGSLTVKGKEIDGTFKGKFNPATGRFRYNLKDSDVRVSIVGRMNAAGTVIRGEINAKYSGISAKGDFEFDKR